MQSRTWTIIDEHHITRSKTQRASPRKVCVPRYVPFSRTTASRLFSLPLFHLLTPAAKWVTLRRERRHRGHLDNPDESRSNSVGLNTICINETTTSRNDLLVTKGFRWDAKEGSLRDILGTFTESSFRRYTIHILRIKSISRVHMKCTPEDEIWERRPGYSDCGTKPQWLQCRRSK